MMSFLTDSAYKIGILTRKKKFYPHFSVQNIPRKVIFAILGHFGSHFEWRPLFGISGIFENMLDVVASYWLCIQNWYSN